jgi:hypothetical protein
LNCKSTKTGGTHIDCANQILNYLNAKNVHANQSAIGVFPDAATLGLSGEYHKTAFNAATPTGNLTPTNIHNAQFTQYNLGGEFALDYDTPLNTIITNSVDGSSRVMTCAEFVLSLYNHFDFSCIMPDQLETFINTPITSATKDVQNALVSLAVKQMMFDSAEMVSAAIRDAAAENTNILIESGKNIGDGELKPIDTMPTMFGSTPVDKLSLSTELRMRAELLAKYHYTTPANKGIITSLSLTNDKPNIGISPNILTRLNWRGE